jgi:integrase
MTLPRAAKGRERRLVGDEEARLLAELAKTPYMAELAELAIETAMRQGELLALTWADIDADKRIAHLTDTKNGESRDVPLSTRAVAIIASVPRPIRDDATIFPLRQDTVIRAFRGACVATGIENLKFHDLRHEAASRICGRMAMQEALRVTGHKTPSMLMRYYHPRAEDLARKLG